MSSTAIGFPAVGTREAVDAVDGEVLRAAQKLLRGGPVCFKLSTRVKAGLLPWWKRRLYVLFCREAPERFKVPPRPAMQLTVFTNWARAVNKCRTPDDQLLVMPFERSYDPNVLDVAVECRPRDRTDAARINALTMVFEGYTGDAGERPGHVLITVDELKQLTSLTDRPTPRL